MRPWYFAPAALVVAADQLSKWLALATLEYGRPVAVLPGFNWTLLFNDGAAFSFLQGAGGWQRWLLSGLSLVISIVIVAMLVRGAERARLELGALSLILGGALGNLVDRLRFGYVVDFIDLYAGEHHWPAFNIADAGITVGAALLVLHILRTPEPRGVRGG